MSAVTTFWPMLHVRIYPGWASCLDSVLKYYDFYCNYDTKRALPQGGNEVLQL